jgi:predicted DNA-binding ribbon-helix-helix protein
VKRSVTVSGHRTSLSLEEAFWQALVAAAREEGKSVAALVAQIDRNREDLNLSSAIRIWILKRLETKAARGSVP